MVRIKDIADELGLSTATVSNVIHGKTKKVSKETVKRVQALLEEKQYIPNMAAVLLAQNNSKIICLVIADHEKYEDKLLQDPFLSALLDELSSQIEESKYFMMIKRTREINEVIRYASMWNMAGLILTGFCKQDYNELRKNMHIPFVVMDGFFEPDSKCANISIDNMDGGYQVGKYLIKKGHRKVLFIADNEVDMDYERYMGLCKAFREQGYNIELSIQFLKVGLVYEERLEDYHKLLQILKNDKQITAIFCASDAYAIEVMNELIDHNVKRPEEISIIGFDDIPAATLVRPKLTTVQQDIRLRAREAIRFLNEGDKGECIHLPVTLIERDSVKSL